MNVWCTFSTIFNQRRVLQIAGLLTLCVAFITMLFLASTTNAAPGVNQTISFQGRLMTPQGQPVAEGYYNIQFKIYQDGNGTSAGNPGGTLEWTETRVNNGGNNAVYVKNGYFSVDLGSVTPFGNSVDWNQDTLWLSMNIAGSSTLCSTFGTAPCSADGEMVPMKRLTAAPYALNAGKVGGKGVDELIHNGTSQQTGNFNISGTGMASLLHGTSGVVTPLLDRADAGTLSIGSTNATSIQIGSGTANQTISIGTGAGDTTLALGSVAGTSSTAIQGGSLGVSITTGGGFTLQGSDSAVAALDLDTTGNVSIGLTEGSAFTIKNSQNDPIFVIQETGEMGFSGGLSSSDNLAAYSSDLEYSTRLSTGTDGTAKINTTGDRLIIQSGVADLLTAYNNNGVANIGIGNDASSGYALDVTGSTNVSGTYAINGVDILSGNSLSFTGASTSTISSAAGQALQLSSGSSVKIGDGVTSASPTLLTLDKGSSAPSATGDAVLGSMYYDTTLGRVQCYEADGWGACSSSPDNFVHLNPEYSNAVQSGSTNGTFESGFCSDDLDIHGLPLESPICSTNETYNYYSWTSEGDEETKDIFVNYQLPANFSGFVPGSTSLMAMINNDILANAEYRVYKSTASGLVACGSSPISVVGPGSWEKLVATGSADPANCGFTANDSLVIKISLTSSLTLAEPAYALVSTLSFAFSQ